MKKRFVITSLISLILVCILLINSTYSIFTTGDVDENANVYTTGNLDVTYMLSDENVKMTNTTPLSNDESIKIKPYRITVVNNGNVAYKFNVLLNDTSTGEKIDYQYVMTQVGKLEPKRLNSCDNNAIISDVVVEAGKSVDIDVRVWLASDIKNTEIGKNFYAKLSISGVATYDSVSTNNSDLRADELSLASSYIADIYNDGSDIKDVYIANDSNKPIVHLNSSRGIMLDNNGEYRYYGKNPSNYVKFNNEMYRIIGVSEVLGNDGKKESRLKIIKNGYSSKNIDYGVNNNDYSVSSVFEYLNNDYYESLSNDAKGLIDDATYYLGAVDNFGYASDFYSQERGTKICNDCDKDRNVSFVGKVGLMYPSDYMYAVDLGLCTVSSSEYNSDSCIGSNWLSLEDEFTITPSINNSSDVVSIRDGVVGVGTSNLKNRPVLYLKSSVSIVSGNGTEDNPYNLEIVD